MRKSEKATQEKIGEELTLMVGSWKSFCVFLYFYVFDIFHNETIQEQELKMYVQSPGFHPQYHIKWVPAYSCNPRTQETEARSSEVQGHP